MRYSICLSGSASGPAIKSAKKQAYEIGAAVAQAGHILTTGATTGLPFFAAQGAKDQGGVSIGFSPAASLREHIRKYRLPCHVFDYINFTGMNYVGRDAYLVQSSDAVISIAGSFGSLHEFTTAIEAHKPCGVLLGSGGTADLVPDLFERLGSTNKAQVVFSNQPKELVAKVLKIMSVEYQDLSDEELKRHAQNFTQD